MNLSILSLLNISLNISTSANIDDIIEDIFDNTTPGDIASGKLCEHWQSTENNNGNSGFECIYPQVA